MLDAFEAIHLALTIVGGVGIVGFLLFVTTRGGAVHRIGAAGMIAAAASLPLGYFLAEIAVF